MQWCEREFYLFRQFVVLWPAGLWRDVLCLYLSLAINMLFLVIPRRERPYKDDRLGYCHGPG